MIELRVLHVSNLSREELFWSEPYLQPDCVTPVQNQNTLMQSTCRSGAKSSYSSAKYCSLQCKVNIYTYRSFNRGSIASRRPSPTKLMLATVRVMTTPEKMASQAALRR
jgi:hypothetical protein